MLDDIIKNILIKVFTTLKNNNITKKNLKVFHFKGKNFEKKPYKEAEAEFVNPDFNVEENQELINKIFTELENYNVLEIKPKFINDVNYIFDLCIDPSGFDYHRKELVLFTEVGVLPKDNTKLNIVITEKNDKPAVI